MKRTGKRKSSAPANQVEGFMGPEAKSDRVRFRFNERKAAAAAAFLLEHEVKSF
jgi:hypothetical protein